jgi:AsmA protein
MRPVKALLKWFLLALAALLLLGGALVVAVVTLVDPAQYRALVTDAVVQATGRTLALDGEVGLKLFPCCAVELERATLGNPPGFAGDPFLRVESARLAIRLWPLITRREIEIGTVRLEGLRANLVGRQDGSNNWSFADSAGDATEGGVGNDVAGISVAGFTIRDAHVEYRDEADDSRYRVEELQLTTGPVRDSAPFDLSISFRLTDLQDNSGGSVQLKAQTSLAVEGDVTTVRLGGLEGELNLRGLAGLDAISGRLLAPAFDVRIADDTFLSAAE